MQHVLTHLETERDRVLRQLSQCGDMRKGTIALRYIEPWVAVYAPVK